MATRDPFEYVAWCAGPSVDISPLSDFPICTEISYAQPTLALHHVDMTLPDLAPPPLCPCVWTYNTEMPDSKFSIEMAPISLEEISGFFEVRPAAGVGQDCCAPEFNVSIDMKLPCMAFEPSLDLSILTGVFTGSFYKDECNLKLALKLSLPTGECINFSTLATGVFTGVGGQFDVTLDETAASCLLKLSYKLSIPCMPFEVANAQDILIGKGTTPVFKVSLTKLANCTLKLSQHISLPCMPFNVAAAHDVAIGNGDAPSFALALSKLSDCGLKLSAHLSLPCMPFEVETAQDILIGNGVTPEFELKLEKLSDCNLKLSGHISLPCMPLAVEAAQDILIGGGDTPVFKVSLTKLANCSLKLSQHLSLPCMPFEVADAHDVAIGGGAAPVFDLNLEKLADCNLKLSAHLSLPCMPFSVADAHDIVIGGGIIGGFDLNLEKVANCGLKLSGHISLPGTGLAVLISAEYSNKTFKIWKQPIKVYKVESVGSPVEVFVAVSCDE